MQERIRGIVQAGWFHRLILAVILLAGLLAGLETSAAAMARHGSLLRALDAAVLLVFIVEIGLKMAAYGRKPWLYFQDGWNVFDFTIVVLCCLPLDSHFSAVFRLARVLRLMRLVTALPKLQLLVGALLKSFSSMGYVGLLLALMMYIYGVAGVHLFRVPAPERFGSLDAALMSLFQVITLDNWSDILNATGSANPVAAAVYFVSFILLGTMIMLNLFIGVIMNSMSDMQAEIQNRNRARHLAATGHATAEDELLLLERRLDEMKSQLARLREGLRSPEPRIPESRQGRN